VSALLDLPLSTLDGDPTSLGALAGRNATLVVNVASRCGLTSQYSQLDALHEEYGPRGSTVVGVPCNQFAGQEPATAEEIRGFCSTTYGVTFPLTGKLDVNGPQAHPVHRELTTAADATGAAGDVQWDFEKFLLDARGGIVARFRPTTRPDSPEVRRAIESLLD
jgi:glutathione peroxidase